MNLNDCGHVFMQCLILSLFMTNPILRQILNHFDLIEEEYSKYNALIKIGVDQECLKTINKNIEELKFKLEALEDTLLMNAFADIRNLSNILK